MPAAIRDHRHFRAAARSRIISPMMISRLAAAVAVCAVLPLAARAQASVAVRWAPVSAAAKPSADAEKFRSVLRHVRDGGVYDPGDATIPPSFMLGDVSGSTSTAHDENFVNVMGLVNPKDGLFYPGMVSFVSERWTIGPKGNWTIDQWLFGAGIDGRVKVELHNVMRKTPDQKMLSAKKLDPAPGAAAQYAALVARWAAYAPQGGKP